LAVTAVESPPVVLHLHIPKTAGSSINKALTDNCRPGRAYNFDIARRIELEQMPEARRLNIDVVIGHMPYGLHHHLRRDYRYVFTLRQPDERILSFYRYVRWQEHHPLHPMVTESNMTFGDFLDLSTVHYGLRNSIDNAIVRQVAGYEGVPDIAMREVLRLACRNTFDERTTYGFVDRMSEFTSDLCAQGLVGSETMHRYNINPDPGEPLTSAIANLTDDQRKTLAEYVEWDNRYFEICRLAYP
jgi:hypothetical protein